MKREDIFIRDPYILLHENVYYMYGTRSLTAWKKPADLSTLGFDVYTSDDLENWSDPIEVFKRPTDFWSDMNFWAPEVHVYNDHFYMFATFNKEGSNKGTQILIADSPTGPFELHSEGPLTPREWPCLDGTLYVDEEGTPFMAFCREWIIDGNGSICVVQLSDDLKTVVTDPVTILNANEAHWHPEDSTRFVTDGPFFHHTKEGKLLMLWSSLKGADYVEAIAESITGSIYGPWKHQEDLLFSEDGGHGMVFRNKAGELIFTMHSPNNSYSENPYFITVEEQEGTLTLK